MMRVTEQSRYNGIVSAIRKNNIEMEMSQNRLSTGKRIQFPHQNVSGAVNSIYYRTRINSIDRFQTNMADGKERLAIAYDSMGEMTKALTRVRELAVQGANGTYTKEDRVIMAQEIEEMLSRVYDISLTKSKGEYIFSGTSVETRPFRAFYRQNDDMGSEIMVGINYEGDANVQNREIEESEYMNVSTPGSYAFWGTNMEIISSTDTAGYIADRNQKIMIDNLVVNIQQGDNIEMIVQRINDSGGNVKATIGMLRGEEKVIQLSTREPHKILLQDIEGGSVLQEIGLVREGLANNPENNYAIDAVLNGKSIFETVIHLRDAMLRDDVATIGSSGIGYIDEAINNVTSNQAKVSAMVARLDMGSESFDEQRVISLAALSKTEDVDYAEEAIIFNTWEYVHRASLLTAGKLLGPTLMDYLR